MNTRRNKINALKQKVNNLKTQISYLQFKEIQFSRSNQKSNRISPQCHSNNRQYKSPTFWNSNPITHQNKYHVEKIVKSPVVFSKESRQQNQKSLSPKIKTITNNVEFNYYMKSTKNLHQKPKKEIIEKVNQEASKRYHQNSFDQERNSPKKPIKIKTFETKKTNPILNPQPDKKSSIKIVKSIQPSPDKFLTDHPKSNTNLYCYRNKKTYLSNKGLMSYKNLSTMTLQHYPKEEFPFKRNNDMLTQKKRKTNKKHFAQYFNDIFVSNIN